MKAAMTTLIASFEAIRSGSLALLARVGVRPVPGDRPAPQPFAASGRGRTSQPATAGSAWIFSALAFAALLLSGCASAPLFDASAPPRPAVAEAWQATLPHAGTATDLVRWWDRFNDPALPPLIAATQSAASSLATATARIERARAARVAAGAAGLPQIDAVASVGQSRSPPRLAQVASASLGLQAGWEIDLFGAVAAGRGAAQARFEGAEAGWHAARVSLAAETATSYTLLRACEAQLVQARADSASRAETARLTQLSADAGFAAPAEAALARAGAAQSRSQAVNQAAQCETLVKSLVEITDLTETDLRQRLAGGTAQVPQPEPIAPASLPAALLSQRPDLADAASAIVAAAGDAAQAAARQRPQVTLSGSVAGLSVRSSGSTSNGTTFSLGPLAISLPLFDGGTRAANTAAARAGYDEAVALYRAQVRRAVREVEQSFVALQSAATRQQDAESAARDFEVSLRAVQARQQGGLASLFELEIARRDALLAQGALIELQRASASAWIELYRALGGGWSGPAQSIATSRP